MKEFFMTCDNFNFGFMMGLYGSYGVYSYFHFRYRQRDNN